MTNLVQLRNLNSIEIYPKTIIDGVDGLTDNLSELRERIGALESGSGTGDGSYNDAELRGRIVVLESDVKKLKEKEDKDTVYDDTDLWDKITELEGKITTGGGTGESYDDTELRGRIEDLESKEDKDTIYDDTELRNKITELEGKIGSGGGNTGDGGTYDDTALKQWVSNNYIKKGEIDLSGYASRIWVEEQNYLTEHQDLSEYIKSSDVDDKLTNLKSEILGGVGEDYDTFKEIESWITTHQDLYDGIITTISSKASKDDITDMATQTWVTSKLSEIKPYDDTKIKQDIANLKIDKADAVWVIENFQPIGNYPTKEEVTQQIIEIVTDGQVSLDGYATETYVENKLKDITSKLNTMSEKLDKLPYINVLPDEETYNQMEKEDNNVYLIEGDPSKFTTQDDLDILQNTIETNVNEKMEDYQLKSNMTDFIKAYDFAQLIMRVEELENKLKEIVEKEEETVENDD